MTGRMITKGSDGGRLRHAREVAGLTQEALAVRAGIGAATVRRAERGEVAPLRMTRRALAEALHVPVAQIWPYDDELA